MRTTLSTGPADLVGTWKYSEEKKRGNIEVRQLFRNIFSWLYPVAETAEIMLADDLKTAGSRPTVTNIFLLIISTAKSLIT